MPDHPILLWLRRDLRLADNQALHRAAASGRPVVPVFVWDPLIESTGAAMRWRLGLGLQAFARTLERLGSRLILRRGAAMSCLTSLIAETGATSVWWNRLYDPEARERDTAIKAGLAAAGIEAQSHGGHLLFEPWAVATGQGGHYRVYTPFWRAVRDHDPGAVLPPPKSLRPPSAWPQSDDLQDWQTGRDMARGAAVVVPHLAVGEAAARDRLDRFLSERLDSYAARRDIPAAAATSGLSENLAHGEISVRTAWQAGLVARQHGAGGAERFLQELAWREFAGHLAFHDPHIVTRNWRPDWDSFPWRGDNDDAERWRRGMTGEPMVDAAQREMYVTGTMHNRARMITASYLTKHLLTDWRVGQRWFADCLVDWDPAANAMGWQWTAGSGPDAAPYFRVFNPAAQAERFDPDHRYCRRFLAEGQADPPATATAYFDAVPRSWHLSPDKPYPEPAITLADGRARALAAHAAWQP